MFLEKYLRNLLIFADVFAKMEVRAMGYFI